MNNINNYKIVKLKIMNTIKRMTVMVLIGIIATTYACNREGYDLFEITNEEKIINSSDIPSFFEDLSDPDHIVEAETSSEVGVLLTSDRGVIYTFPAGSYVLKNGDPYVGDVSIKVTELLTRSEMFLYGRPTISNGKIIESDGEFLIDVRSNPGDEELFLASGVTLNIKIPNNNPDNDMELFYGEGEEEDFTWQDQGVDPNGWANIQNSEWQTQDSTGWNFGYECFSENLQWINVDKFYQEFDEDELTTVCLELPEEYTNTNTSAFMVFNDYDSFLNMWGTPVLKQFCEPYGATPIGFNITFVTISKLTNDTYFLGTATVDVTENHLELITPVEMSFDDIKAFIDGL